MLRKLLKFLLHRVVIVGTFIAIQAAILIGMIWKFNSYFVYFYAFCLLLSAGVVLYIISNKSNPGYKIAWIILILLFPIFGGLFYVMFGENKLSKKQREKMSSIGNKMTKLLKQEDPVWNEIKSVSETASTQSRYICDYALCPPYKNTYTEYLPLGEIAFERMKEELEKAEHYIFMEYFIIQEGVMWDGILEILERKVKQGVDVRVIYDDMGCILTLPYGYNKKLEKMGIKCQVFNPFVPILSARFNNRDHRKILVIDGHTGFTGGINLADEYINAYEKHGHWKDTAIMLKGEGVWSMTNMFLTLWDYIANTDEDYEIYRPHVHMKEVVQANGYVQPFTDSPHDHEAVGETVYLNLINRAKKYVYINTPYLIIDNEMITALCVAAKSGVDVRIVTPHIPDKWYVHAVTRAYYDVLLESGVKIYEYTPGFIHAKTFVVDDLYSVVGTINLDYRSLYLHFECGVWLYKTDTVMDVKADYLETLKVCKEVTLAESHYVKWYRKLGRAVLRIFAPLM
ncbi:cardiolipin synthase [Niameybacter massiliensis]|uniref:cardiolipin synthase n=1 Tax=Niameybacter massiliensis TaxID=1658108 RepID=UPI0006B550A4|nr:cardiolipin synthase [Niameybacter massiliensis]